MLVELYVTACVLTSQMRECRSEKIGEFEGLHSCAIAAQPTIVKHMEKLGDGWKIEKYRCRMGKPAHA